MVMTRARGLIVGVVVLVAVALLAVPAIVLAGQGSGATSPPSGNSNAVSPSKRARMGAENSAVDSRVTEHLECWKRRAALQDPSL